MQGLRTLATLALVRRPQGAAPHVRWLRGTRRLCVLRATRPVTKVGAAAGSGHVHAALLRRGYGTERRWVFLVTAVERCSQGVRLLVLEGRAAARRPACHPAAVLRTQLCHAGEKVKERTARNAGYLGMVPARPLGRHVRGMLLNCQGHRSRTRNGGTGGW